MILARLIAVILALLAAAPVRASDAETAPMSFSVFWPCTGNASFCAPTVLARGTIQSDTDKAFARFLADKARHAHPLPPKLRVAFDSPGGSLRGGIALGRLLRKLEADVVVGSEYAQVEKFSEAEVVFIARPMCASACTLAFAGGTTREIEKGARFGLHRFASASGDMGEGQAQAAVVALAGYLEEMGVDRRMLDVASVVDHKGIHWLALEDARALNIDNLHPPLAPWTIDATAHGTAYVITEQQRPAGTTVRVAFGVQGREPFVIVTVSVLKTAATRTAPSRFPLGEPGRLQFEVDGRRIFLSSAQEWQLLQTANLYTFNTIAMLSLGQLRRIGAAQTLKLDSDAFSNSIADLSPATALSTRGLASGVALLLRSP